MSGRRDEKMEVEYYHTAEGREVVAEFLDSLPDKDLAKVFRDIELLSQYAPNLHEPYTKHIDGPIWELRSKFSSNIYRIFYFIWSGDKLILLHGFTKKTQKTPPSEIKIAKERYEDYVKRYS
jgi:phage-related protein